LSGSHGGVLLLAVQALLRFAGMLCSASYCGGPPRENVRGEKGSEVHTPVDLGGTLEWALEERIWEPTYNRSSARFEFLTSLPKK
jgi:hypothetical protein